MSGLTLVTAATDRPVSLAEAKQHLRVDGTDEDALIETLIEAAAEACRGYTGRELLNQTWRFVADGFGGADDGWWSGVRQGAMGAGGASAITLPRPPLASVTSLVTYGPDDAPVTFPAAGYIVDTVSQPGRIVPRQGYEWPGVLRAANGVEITFVAGHGTRARDVPMALRRGMVLLVADLFEGREAAAAATLPDKVRALWQPFRLARL